MRLLPPPREVPPGLRLRVVAHYDVVASTMYSVPAVLFLVPGLLAPGNEKVGRVAFILLGTFFLVLALQAALSRLFIVAATLRRMRMGELAAGRIVSCRFAWDSTRAQLPYPEFLADWPGHMARSQTGKVAGCLSSVVALMFLVPMVIAGTLGTIALIWRGLGLPHGNEMTGDLTGAYWAKTVAAFALFALALLWHLRRWRKWVRDETTRVMEREMAPVIGAHPALRQPLPERSNASPELICDVEYEAGGEKRRAVARATLSNELPLSGSVEVLYDPAAPAQADLLLGLPPGTHAFDGHWWIDAPPAASSFGLPAAALSMGLALVLFVNNLQLLRI